MNIIIPKRLRQMADEILNEVNQTIFTEQEREYLTRKGLSIESNYLDDINASKWEEFVK
jgi:hypothetical protein